MKFMFLFYILPILSEETDQLSTFMKVNLVNKVQTLWHLLLETKHVSKKLLYKKWSARDLVSLELECVLWELALFWMGCFCSLHHKLCNSSTFDILKHFLGLSCRGYSCDQM